MSTTLERTNTQGVFRRHAKGCEGGRCLCPYVVVRRHRGKQHKETFRTLAEARAAKGKRDAGDRRPVARIGFADSSRNGSSPTPAARRGGSPRRRGPSIDGRSR